jgi:hypothetical protein
MGRRHARDRVSAALEIRRCGDDVERGRGNGAQDLAVRPRCAVRAAEVSDGAMLALFFLSNNRTTGIHAAAHTFLVSMVSIAAVGTAASTCFVRNSTRRAYRFVTMAPLNPVSKN